MKSIPSFYPHMNNVTGENTFVNSALLDVVTGWLDEIDTYVHTFGTMSVVLAEASVSAERAAAAT